MNIFPGIGDLGALIVKPDGTQIDVLFVGFESTGKTLTPVTFPAAGADETVIVEISRSRFVAAGEVYTGLQNAVDAVTGGRHA